jgi:hypothetical protein
MASVSHSCYDGHCFFQVDSFPDDDWLNYPLGQSFKWDVQTNITQECASHIDLVVNETNLLNPHFPDRN